jgi:hypothetical protein
MIAYLMCEKNMSVKEAYTFVKSKRKNARPNVGFLVQLVEYEKQLMLLAQSNGTSSEQLAESEAKESRDDVALSATASPSIPPELLDSLDEKKIYDFLNAPVTPSSKTGKK